MKILNVIDNRLGSSGYEGLAVEHGLSYFIECAGLKLIFDVGESGLFLENASVLGLDPADAELIVCSHGHYDHSGGLKHALGAAAGPELLVGDDFFQPKYKPVEGGYSYNGVPFSREELTAAGANISFAGSERELAPGLFLLSRVSNSKDSNFFLKQDEEYVLDHFLDECFLVYEESDGVTVVTGCSHPGIGAMLARVNDRFAGKRVKLLVGGLHLFRSEDAEVLEIGRALLDYGVERVAVSHCTGERILELMDDERFFHFGVGDLLEI